jgi:tetratricopeptide (TPR) repeat protein
MNMFGSALGTVYDVSSWPWTNVSNTWDVRDSVHLSAARWAYGLPKQAAPVPAQKQYDELQTRAQQLADAKNFQSAAAIYEQLLRATPNSPQVLNDLGAAYAHLENYTQAQKAYERALRVEPHSFRGFSTWVSPTSRAAMRRARLSRWRKRWSKSRMIF